MLFKVLDFEIIIEMNKSILQYLDFEFKLSACTFSLYMKSNIVLNYMNTKSTPRPM